MTHRPRPLTLASRSLRRGSIAIALLWLFAGHAACDRTGGTVDGKPQEASIGAPSDAIVIAVPKDAESIIPNFGNGTIDDAVSEALFLPLLEADFDCGVKFRSGIAKSWSFSDDGTEVSMVLRDDLSWSDGTPVTAQDVAFSFDLVTDPVTASPRASYATDLRPDARPRVIGAYQVAFGFRSASDPAIMLSDLASVGIVPKHALQDENRERLRTSAFNRAPVVSGPFRLSSWEPGSRIVLVPNERWKDETGRGARLRQVVFEVSAEYGARLLGLLGGRFDHMVGLGVPDVDQISQAHPEIRLLRRGWRGLDFIAWNTVDPADWKAAVERSGDPSKVDRSKVAPNRLFGDAPTRLALGEAIDSDRMIADLLTSKTKGESYGRRAVGTFSPSICGLDDRTLQPLTHDAARARADLARAGWSDTDGDGILDRNGHRFSFKLVVPNSTPRRKDAATIAQSNLAEVGVDLQIEMVDHGTYVARATSRDFDAVLGGWNVALFPEPETYWASGPEHPYNLVSYQNPKVDAWIDELHNSRDPDHDQALFRDIQAEVYRDQPYAFLYWIDEIVAVNGRFHDVQVNLLSPTADLHRWWVPPDQVKYR
jgi:peptide/nickel transport system substrate-binding protein